MLCDRVCCYWLAGGWWFYMGATVSSTIYNYQHDIAEILLKLRSILTAIVYFSINVSSLYVQHSCLTLFIFDYTSVHLVSRERKINKLGPWTNCFPVLKIYLWNRAANDIAQSNLFRPGDVSRKQAQLNINWTIIWV